jgi:S1-C subfamily serine protease
MGTNGKRAIGWPVRSATAALALSVLTFSDPSEAGADDVPVAAADVADPDAVGVPQTLLPIEATFAAWMDDAAARTVRVESTGGMRGSGTLVSPEHVLTAAHVVQEDRVATITLRDGRTLAGRVLRVDAARDLALIGVPETELHCAPVAERTPALGAWVVSAGILGGVEHELPATSSVGLVLAVTSNDLILRQGIAHGMSGGPVLSAAGEIVGVVTRLDAAASVVRGDRFLDGVACAETAVARDVPRVTFDEAEWNTERDRAIASTVGSRPTVTLGEIATRAATSIGGSSVELARWSVHTRGVAVAPELVLTSVDPNVAREASCSAVHITGREALACTEVIVAGELMLLRFPGAGLRALALDETETVTPARGQILSTADAHAWGVVDATTLAPGHLEPWLPPLTAGHCGTLWNMRREQSPSVDLGSVLAHDVSAMRGELLLDAQGRAAAIDVGGHVLGRGYAVPIAEALARFHL